MIIVADGPSARGFVPPDDIPIIAVNGAIDWISRADHWFTLDPSPANRHRMSNPRPGTKYHAAVDPHTPLPAHVVRYLRVGREWPKMRGIGEAYARLKCAPGLSERRDVIHTGNSAYGAIGLAYQMGARKVALVGVDATTDRRVSGGRSRDLSHLPALIASAMGQIDMVSCGALATVPQCSIDEAVRWLRK